TITRPSSTTLFPYTTLFRSGKFERGRLAVAREETGKAPKLQSRTPPYWVCSEPAGSKFKSKLNLGSAFRVKVSRTPYSFTPPLRSEEHTLNSSHLVISYAVF